MNPKKLSQILTHREIEYARMVAECLSNKEIGERFGVSWKTVRLKLHIIYEKIGWAGEGYLKPRIMLALWYDRERHYLDSISATPAHDLEAQRMAAI